MIGNEQIEESDVERILELNFDDWDARRAEGLDDLLIFQNAKTEADERNFARLEIKYGATHPLTLEARASIETNKIFVSELKREIVRTKTNVPTANADAWTVYGNVLDTENETVANAPVVIFDAEDGQILRTQKTKTNADGYFRLQIGNLKNLPEAVRVGVPPNFMSEAVFAPEAGETDYAEIFVTGEIKDVPPDCEPLPEPSGEPIPTGINFSDWLITGKITDSKGNGIANLKVRFFDKDLMFDDALGETETNADGVYRLIFTKEQFSDIVEKHPELYLIIEDDAGNRLFDGKREAKGKAGRIELIDVQLKEYTGKTGKLKQ